MNSTIHYLGRRSKFLLLACGIILVAVLGLADYFSGSEIAFSIFYFVPIYLAARYMGKWYGVAISAISVAMWLTADLLGGAHYSNFAIPVWNALMRLGVFLVVAYYTSVLEELNEGLERKVEERTKALTSEISERQAIETVLKRSESFHRHVIENAGGVPFQLVFGSTIGTGYYEYVGEGIRDILGVAPGELTEARFHELVEEFVPLLPDVPLDPLECRTKMMQGGFPHYKADLRVRAANGEEKWLNDSSLPLRDEKTGKVIGAFGILLDVTERKHSEEALRRSEEQYRSLFDRMMDGVYRSTHGGRFVDVNAAMVRMFGYSSKEELLKVDIRKDLYFAPEDRDSLFLDMGREKVDIFRMKRKDGSAIWVEDHAQYLHDEKGNVTFHEGILRNVTDRLQAEKRLREEEHLLSEAQRISHLGSWEIDFVTDKLRWSVEITTYICRTASA